MKNPAALNPHIIAIIADGEMGEDVIDFSEETGAAGGTVLHGRGFGVYNSGKFLGLDILPEKDTVLILVSDGLTDKVMDVIDQGINIDIPGNGIYFSIDIDKVISITEVHQYRGIIGMREFLDKNNDRKKSEL